MRNILVTGTTGFIGRQLLRTIEASGRRMRDRFVVLGAPNPEYSDAVPDRRANSLYQFEMDDFRVNGLDRIDTVIHLGAFMPHQSSQANDIDQSISNIINLRHLLSNLPSGPTQFIFASTIDVYGTVEGLISEDTPTLPNTLYGHSKLFCEKILEEWQRSTGGLLQILRIGHIYGEGEEQHRKLIPATIERLVSGKRPVVFGQGIELRSFLHVSDCCEFILRSLDLSRSIGPVNLASARSVTVLELVRVLCEISRAHMGVQVEPETGECVTQSRNVQIDNSKMLRLLGPESVPLLDGLRNEYRSMLALASRRP